MFDVVTSGPPNAAGSVYPAGARTASTALDTNTGAEWVNALNGWQGNNSNIAKADVLATVAAQASLLVFTVPVTGLYDVSAYASQNTATNGTLPSFTLTYTDADTSTLLSATPFVTGAATTGIGQAQSAEKLIKAKAGTTITVSSGAPTTLTANVSARIAFAG